MRIPHPTSQLHTDDVHNSSLAVFNSVQNFITTNLTKRIYNKSPASGMSASIPTPVLR